MPIGIYENSKRRGLFKLGHPGGGFLGKEHSEESKRKMSLRRKGKPLSESVRLKLVGKRHSEATRVKMSIAHSGDKARNWKGGITPLNRIIRHSLKYRIWREKVFERDNYTCQICLVRGGELNADHIKPFAYFPELRFDLNNGRVLCLNCHKKTDTFGWKSKNETTANLWKK